MTDIKTTQQLFNLIDKAREEEGLSGRKLSEEAGTSTAYWLSVKNNEGNMTVRSLLAVCEVLGLKVSVTRKGRK